MVTRKNIWQLGGPWADDVLWYARGVQVLQQRALDDVTSWRFFAGIHGFHAGLWSQLGYLSPSDQQPDPGVQATFWQQCQHGTWYFLPWHRGYVWGIETMVRQAVVELGGPDDWALPYWNYFGAGEAGLPQELAEQTWPGDGPNPLFVTPRYGPDGDGDVFIPTGEVDLSAMAVLFFTGSGAGGDPGFGGVDTGFSHGGSPHGDIESQPHDMCHVLIGGARGNDNRFPGAMSVPASAALDPVFWLHHANIDRLWSAWIAAGDGREDPTDPAWLAGPAGQGGRPFVVPLPDGSTWAYTPADVLTTEALGYVYDDLAPAVDRDGTVAGPMAAGHGRPAGGAAMAEPGGEPELVGASATEVPLKAQPSRAVVAVDGGRLRESARVLAAGRPGAGAPAAPERVLLNLENVRGTADAHTFAVYVGLPEGDDHDAHPELRAGTIGLFGVTDASDADGDHAGQGLTYVLDISRIVQEADLADAADAGELPVTLVPIRAGDTDPDVTIGRVSLFRQPG